MISEETNTYDDEKPINLQSLSPVDATSNSSLGEPSDRHVIFQTLFSLWYLARYIVQSPVIPGTKSTNKLPLSYMYDQLFPAVVEVALVPI